MLAFTEPLLNTVRSALREFLGTAGVLHVKGAFGVPLAFKRVRNSANLDGIAQRVPGGVGFKVCRRIHFQVSFQVRFPD